MRVCGQWGQTSGEGAADTPSSPAQRRPSDKARADSLGLGQRFAVATAEVCSRVMAGDNEVSIRWVPAHCEIAGNEKANEYAKAAASRSAPGVAVPDE